MVIHAQEVDVRSEVPTTGGMRPGPIGAIPPSTRPRARGERPVALRIPTIAVDTEVESASIIENIMENPTGPWIVAWYVATGRLGAPGNVVMSGHVDYAGVGPAVFARLDELQPEDPIEVMGYDQDLYRFQVDWVKSYPVASAPVLDIVGRTSTESLTLITCSGTFSSTAGAYDQRLVVRATRQP